MTKILRCPICNERDQITVLRTGTRYYEAELSKDGSAINVGSSVDFIDDDFGESYECGDCQHDSYKATDFIGEIE